MAKPNNKLKSREQNYTPAVSFKFALPTPPHTEQRLTLPSMRYGLSPLVSLNSLIRSASNAYPRGVTELSHRHTARSDQRHRKSHCQVCWYNTEGLEQSKTLTMTAQDATWVYLTSTNCTLNGQGLPQA